MARNNKKTSNRLASKASEVLQDGNSSKTAKRLAGSILSQSNTSKQTGKKIEDLASKVLKSKKYNQKSKSLAASALSQSNRKR